MSSDPGGQLNSMPYAPNLKPERIYQVLLLIAKWLWVHKYVSQKRHAEAWNDVFLLQTSAVGVNFTSSERN